MRGFGIPMQAMGRTASPGIAEIHAHIPAALQSGWDKKALIEA